MSGAQSSALDQFAADVSGRSGISRNRGGPLEASTTAPAPLSSSKSGHLSTTPASTLSTDYNSLAVISSTLSLSTASLTTGSAAEQHDNSTAAVVATKTLTESRKPRLQARTNATVILDRNTAVPQHFNSYPPLSRNLDRS